jgi:hypothetical protein
MTTASRRTDSWVSATVDVVLAVVGFAFVWYPMVSLGNAVLGAPLAESRVTLVVGVLAFGGAYPVVAGDWSLGRLGEFVFAMTTAALGLGVLGMGFVLAAGVTLPGSSRIPQAIVWSGAYLLAYFVVYRTGVTIFY